MLPSEFQKVQNYPLIKNLIKQMVDQYVADLRIMLQVPLKIKIQKGFEPEILVLDTDAQCRLSAFSLILDILAGLSIWLTVSEDITFPVSINEQEKRFKNLMVKYYPWRKERLQNLRKIKIMNILWWFLNNPSVHVFPPPKGPLGVSNVEIMKNMNFSKQFVDTLERKNSNAYVVSNPTFRLDNSTFCIDIAHFYWGMHGLLWNLFSDSKQMTQIEGYLQSNIKVIT